MKGNVKEYEIQQLGVTVVLYVSFDIIYLLLVRLYFHNLLLISSVILLQLTLGIIMRNVVRQRFSVCVSSCSKNTNGYLL